MAGDHATIDFIPGTIQMYTIESDGSFNEQITLSPPPTTSPNDPLNWSPWRKYWHASLVLFITGFTAAIANDAGSVSDELLDELNIDYAVANTAAGVLFLAIGWWTLLASPMVWLYGRRIQYFICLLFAVGGSIWFARIQNIQDSIWNQLFIGASESCAEALVQLSLSDLFFQHQRGTVLGIYILATSVGTFLGPLVSGYIANDAWRWVGWTAAIIAGATFIICWFGLEETSFHREAILGRHLGGQPIETFPSDSPHKSPSLEEKHQSPSTAPSNDLPPVVETTGSAHEAQVPSHHEALLVPSDPPRTYWQRIAPITKAPNVYGLGLQQYLLRLIHIFRVFTFPAVIYAGLQWGAQDAWLSFYLTVEEDNYYDPPWNYSNAAVAIMNIPTLIGSIIGCFYGGYFSDVFVRWMAKRRGGVSEAEDRLWLLFASALINPTGLMLFGITSAKGYSWPAPYVGLGMIGFGWGCAGDLSMAYLMDCYPDMVLEGMVGVAVINNTLACIFTFTCSDWINASGLSGSFVGIGVLSFVFQMLTIPMLIWGKSFRRWTLARYKRFLYLRDGL